jgi:flagellar hook protein FlgE
MLDSIYIGLTGMTSFQRNLSVIGNNVSNLNSAGFKASELSLRELRDGAGVVSGTTRVMFKQGTLRQTGSATDVAVDGNGFFVLREGDKTFYTRDGGFQFDADGFLVADKARVAAFSGGSLRDVNIAGIRGSAPRATATVRLVDNLSSGDSDHDVTVGVFDVQGTSHSLTLHFTNTNAVTPRSWLLEVRDETGSVLSSGEIRFNGDGSPASGFSSHAFSFTPLGGVPSSPIVLDFGQPGGFAGATNFSAGTDSTLRLGSQDGFAPGALQSVTFDADGVLVAKYSNGQTLRDQRLALAFFDQPQDLASAGAARFENRTGQRIVLGNAHDGVFGAIVAESLESANVDLAAQFSELIISQRGYQSSSQVVSTANELIQQLLDLHSKR